MSGGIRDGLAALIRAEAARGGVLDPVRVFTRPLVRAGSEDPMDIGMEPTPEAFEAEAPHWLLPSVVVGSRINRVSDGRRGGLTARWVVTLAYYAGPDGEDLLPELSWLVGVAVDRPGAVIPLPGGRSGRARIPHDLSGAVPVPEFPGSGYVMLERIEIPTVWSGGVERA